MNSCSRKVTAFFMKLLSTVHINNKILRYKKRALLKLSEEKSWIQTQWDGPVKGQCHEIFSSQQLFHQAIFSAMQLLLVPLDTPRKDFKFCRIFVELFEFLINYMVYLPQGSRHSPVYSPPGNQDSPVCSSPRNVVDSGSHFTTFKEHSAIFTGIIIQKIDCGLLYLPNDLRFIFEKCPTLRKSNQLPDDKYTRESISNTNKSTISQQNYWGKKNCFMNKTEEKSCDTTPLKRVTKNTLADMSAQVF